MKILHFVTVRKLTAGQRKQLEFEDEARQRLTVDWDQIVLVAESSGWRGETCLPRGWKKYLCRALYSWWMLTKVQKDYDWILHRHIPCDGAGLLFSAKTVNRVSYHHSKEPISLKEVRTGMVGALAAKVESVVGTVVIRRSRLVAAVTDDILTYQMSRSGSETGVLYSNGVSYEQVKCAEDFREQDQTELLVVASKFSSWKGLDEIVESLARWSRPPILHVAGELGVDQRLSRVGSEFLRNRALQHGVLGERQLSEVAARCDAGLASAAGWRVGLEQGGSLKVAEYLSRGLPVIATVGDSRLPNEFPYYVVGPLDDEDFIREKLEYFRACRREEIREEARKYVEKGELMKQFADKLQSVAESET